MKKKSKEVPVTNFLSLRTSIIDLKKLQNVNCTVSYCVPILAFNIDSITQYIYFNISFSASLRNSIFDVWVLGVNVDDQWLFHDGNHMSSYCQLSVSNHPNANNLQARSVSNFICHDSFNHVHFQYTFVWERIYIILWSINMGHVMKTRKCFVWFY